MAEKLGLSLLLRASALCVLLIGSGLGYADNHSADDVRKVVEQNVVKVLSEYERVKPLFDENPDQFFAAMDAALSEIVDFKRIAARVMGKYARQATKEQRRQFSKVFKDSLFDSYTKTLVDTGSFTINVTNAQLNSRSDERAQVDMDVISGSGNVYPVIYSMYKNKQGHWLMENVIVFGVNVGLAFRDKFEALYRAEKGDISAVIAGWKVDIDLDLPDELAAASK